MSLRDLATAACAPDGAGPSSLNPLSRLADAVLPAPLSGRPAPRGAASSSGSAAGSASASAAPRLTAEEAALLSADAPSGLDLLQHAPPPGTAARPALPQHLHPPPPLPHHPAPPPPPPPPPLHAPPPPLHAPSPLAAQFLAQPGPHAVLPPLPPLPMPARGAPTDVFERAFRDTAGPAPPPPAATATAPAPLAATAHAHQHYAARHTAAYPPLRHAAHAPAPHFAAPAPQAWQPTPEMLLSSLSLGTAPAPLTAQQPAAAAPLANAAAAAVAARTDAGEAVKAAGDAAATASASAAAAAAASGVASAAGSAREGSATVPSSLSSWGDEFTSFESAELGSIAHVAPTGGDEVDRGIDALYADWLAASAAETGYTFSVGAGTRGPGERAADVLARAEAARADGRLAAAVRLFETALQPAARAAAADNADRLDRPDAARAWFLLGVTLAEADDDARAIRALEQGLALYDGEERARHPLLADSLVALAVSHTNESDGGLARAALREWLEVRGGPSGTRGADEADADADADIVEGLRSVAATRAGDEVAALTGLGIVHNVRREYERAAHMLRHAVQQRPEEATLWNKLGATLANGGRHDEALRAYRKAVDLRPTLIRAWVNVGTAYTNRGEMDKAVRYYLKAIALAREQGEVGDASSDEVEMRHVWGYVRSALIALRRPDLLELATGERLDALRSQLRC